MHVHTLKLCIHNPIILVSMYKIAHIYLLVTLIIIF
jgi:hypothetical protein